MNLLAAFFLGLAGSLHCAVMCGPLVLAVHSARGQGGGVAGFLHNASYQGGRIVTYIILGAIAGTIGSALVFAGFQRWLSIVAGCLILTGALASMRGQRGGYAGRLVMLIKARFSGLLHRRGLGPTLLLGALNGLLPCGLVYVACTAAAVAGGATGGMLSMLAFGLGTAPMLLGIGLAGKMARFGNPLRLRKVVLICAAVSGALLIVRGLSLGIPYLSPHYIDGLGPVCACQKTL